MKKLGTMAIVATLIISSTSISSIHAEELESAPLRLSSLLDLASQTYRIPTIEYADSEDQVESVEVIEDTDFEDESIDPEDSETPGDEYIDYDEDDSEYDDDDVEEYYGFNYSAIFSCLDYTYVFDYRNYDDSFLYASEDGITWYDVDINEVTDPDLLKYLRWYVSDEEDDTITENYYYQLFEE